jgi:2-polyprenyl-6-methoxyphenol hydroxylase-like FAD-dependent oxidoreductase
MPAVRSALIVGGGPAGLTAAIALARAGTSADVVEIEREWTPEGVGLLLQTAPLRALERLGLLDECRATGFVHHVIRFCDRQGRVLYQTPSREPAPVGISRAALHSVLAAAAVRLGCAVRLGLTVSSLAQSPDAVEVRFSDGSAAAYDLVVGADGIHSRVRELVFGPHRFVPRYAGQVIWRVGLRRPPALDRYHMLQGSGDKVGLVPISAGELYLFMVQTAPRPARPARSDMAERLRNDLQPYGSFVPALLDQIDDSLAIDYRGLQHVLVRGPWHQGRVLLVGDAAHATTPHLAFGVGLAIEDAIVLGELVAGPVPVAELLARFMERRFERCRMVVENSLQLCRWEQHPGDPEADPQRLSAETFAALERPL